MNIIESHAAFGTNYDVGWVGFVVRHGDFVSEGISWFSRWDALPKMPTPTHAFIITGQDSTVEAFSNGVQPGSLQNYLDDKECALLVRKPAGWTLDMGRRIVQEANRHIGEHYGYGLIVALAVQNSFLGHGLDILTRGWFGRTVDRLGDAKRHEICSQLVAKCLQKQPELSHLGVLVYAAETITPAKLFFSDPVYEPGGATELLP